MDRSVIGKPAAGGASRTSCAPPHLHIRVHQIQTDREGPSSGQISGPIA